MTMRLFPILCAGFVASFIVAMGLGGALRLVHQSSRSTGTYFEPEVAGIVTLMTVCYVLVHRCAESRARRSAPARPVPSPGPSVDSEV